MDYKKLFDKAGKKIGWDFSRLNKQESGVRWDFYQEVLKKCDKNTVLLDIGTGGGKRVLCIKDKVRLLVGIDYSEDMINTARKNLLKSKAKNAYFYTMNAKKICFPDEFFDVISCRHSVIFPKEYHRLLKPGGWFLTQQIGEEDKANIKKYFGRGQNMNKKGTQMNRYAWAMKKVGFKNIKRRTYNSTEWYGGAEDLIFLLQYTPTIPNFGSKPEDMDSLARFIADNKEKRGIKTNSDRYLLIGQK